MRQSWTWFLVVCCFAGGSTAASGQGLPKGCAGLPVGTYITIEGVTEHSKFYNLKVEVLNGKKLEQPLFLDVSNVALVSNQRYVFKGYESLGMIGTPPAVEEAAKEAGERPGPILAAGWQVHHYFVALSVVSPKGVKLIQRDNN